LQQSLLSNSLLMSGRWPCKKNMFRFCKPTWTGYQDVNPYQ
jgi:hypothetical protein